MFAAPAFATAPRAVRTGPSDALHDAQACAENSSCYWPAHALDAFLLRMAASGHCVSAAMMLGDRHYALEQLTLAHALQDRALQELAQELATYFVPGSPLARRAA